MKNKFYITTTIPYANAPPHIGFALEIVQADILSRWHFLMEEDVFFLTGTDEHGVKNYKTAKEEGLTPQHLVDKNSNYFKELTKTLNISNNNFIRTTDKKVHWPGVIKLWEILNEKGDIYKKVYEGYYCYGCERFVTEKDLVGKKCPNHPNLELEFISEENYFFKLSKYSNRIKELIKENKIKIVPEKWKNDFLSLIKDGLTDVSFSREKKHLPWGIPVPRDDTQVLYVWPDALTSYLTGIGYPNKKYKKYWPADVHVVGKDMLRFHTGIWPGMLLSSGIELPKEVIVHGFLTVNGQKISKSLGNAINPLLLVNKYGVDPLRYFLIREIPFGEDGDFSEEALKNRLNNELANELGNLVSRTLTLVEKNFVEIEKTKIDSELSKGLSLDKIKELMKKYELHNALSEIFRFISLCNKYVNDNKPWEMKDKEKLNKILYNLLESLRIISILLSPFIPETSNNINKQLNIKSGLLKDCKLGLIKEYKIKKSEILFKKIN